MTTANEKKDNAKALEATKAASAAADAKRIARRELSAKYRVTKDQLKAGTSEVMRTLGEEYAKADETGKKSIASQAAGAIRLAAKLLGRRLAEEAWVSYVSAKSGDEMPNLGDVED